MTPACTGTVETVTPATHLVAPAGAPLLPEISGDERLARQALRGQIGRIERAIAGLVAEAFPVDLGLSLPSGGSARLLGLAELEALRDSLAQTLETARRTLTAVRADQERARGAIEAMLADPGAYRWQRVSREQAGLSGCGHWHVLPRFGLLGMLMGWWRVKISSGCPLAGHSGQRRIRPGG